MAGREAGTKGDGKRSPGKPKERLPGVHTRVKANFEELNLITTCPRVFLPSGEGKKLTLAPQLLGDTTHTQGAASYPTWHSFHAFLHTKAPEDIPNPRPCPLCRQVCPVAPGLVSCSCSSAPYATWPPPARPSMDSGPFLTSPQLDITRCCGSSLRNGSSTVWVTFLLIHKRIP